MTQLLSRPYRTAATSRVIAGPWEVHYAGQTVENPQELRGWDYATDITLRRSVTVDVDAVRTDCGLPADAPVSVLIVWEATGTKTRGASPPQAVWTGGAAVPLLAHLDGCELADRLRMATRLVLADDLTDAGPFVARRRGSILWEDRAHAVALEGGLARFPITVTDFAGTKFHAEALWALGWDPFGLDRPALGSICLYINRSHPAHALITGPEPSETAISALRADVARSMLEGALDNEEFDPTHEWPDDSVGHALAVLHSLVFESADAATTRSLRSSDRARFESQIQAAMALMRS